MHAACSSTATACDLTKSDDVTTEGPFGIPVISAAGQVITAPAGGLLLSSFGFVVNIPSSYQIIAHVAQWDNAVAQIIQPVLYTSPVFNGNGVTGLLSVNLAAPLVLTPSTQYLLFFAAVDGDGDSGSYQVFYETGTSVYAGGYFASQNSSPTDFSGSWAYVPTKVMQFQFNAA